MQEIVAALESNCNIIPIIDNFQWPEAEQLPEDMRAVCYFNGVRCVGSATSKMIRGVNCDVLRPDVW